MQDKKACFPPKDERTIYVKGRAAHYTFIISVWFLVRRIWHNGFSVDVFGLPVLNAVQALEASILVMVAI